MPRRSREREVVIIMWRDIPAQVNGRFADERTQVVLPRRFQRAIDDAAMVAGKKTASEYVGEWRRVAVDSTGATLAEVATEVAGVVARITAALTRERLGELVANGGWEPHPPASEGLSSGGSLSDTPVSDAS